MVHILLMSPKAKRTVGMVSVREKGITVLVIPISYTINPTVIVIMIHLLVTKEMDFTTMANINLHHGEVEDGFMSQDLMVIRAFLGMKVWGKPLVMKGIKWIINLIKSLTVRSLQVMTPK